MGCFRRAGCESCYPGIEKREHTCCHDFWDANIVDIQMRHGRVCWVDSGELALATEQIDANQASKLDSIHWQMLPNLRWKLSPQFDPCFLNDASCNNLAGGAFEGDEPKNLREFPGGIRAH